MTCLTSLPGWLSTQLGSALVTPVRWSGETAPAWAAAAEVPTTTAVASTGARPRSRPRLQVPLMHSSRSWMLSPGVRRAADSRDDITLVTVCHLWDAPKRGEHPATIFGG